jgi:hypothetical protein
VVEVSVDQHDIAMRLLLRGRGETESREGRKAWTTGTREERAWSEGRVGKPKRIGFEEGEFGAVAWNECQLVLRCESGGMGGKSLRIGDPWLMKLARSPAVEDRAELSCLGAITPSHADLRLDKQKKEEGGVGNERGLVEITHAPTQTGHRPGAPPGHAPA